MEHLSINDLQLIDRRKGTGVNMAFAQIPNSRQLLIGRFEHLEDLTHFPIGKRDCGIPQFIIRTGQTQGQSSRIPLVFPSERRGHGLTAQIE